MTQQSELRAEMRSYLRFIYRHGKELGGLLVLAGSVLAILALFTYLHAIGRPDLFLESTSIGPALFVWLLFCLFIAIACLAVALVPSYYLMLTVMVFNAKDYLIRSISVRVFIIVVIGFLFICALLYSSVSLAAWYTMPAIYLAILVLCFLFFFVGRRSRLKYLRGIGRRGNRKTAFWLRFGFMFWLAFLSMVSSFTGYFPAVFSFWAYRGSDESVFVFLSIAFLSMVISCAPYMLYALSRREGLRRYKHGLLGALGVVVAFCVMSPAVVDMITYKVAGSIGLRDEKETRYFVEKGYPVSEFDAETWKVSSDLKSGFVISGFRLYGLGKNVLFCPSEYLEVSLKDWPKYSGKCVALDSSKIRSLPAKDAKPKPKPVAVGSDSLGCVSAVRFTRVPLLLDQRRVCVFKELR